MRKNLLIGLGMSFLGFILLVAAGCVHQKIAKKIAVVPAVPGAKYLGNEFCIDCHEDSVADFQKTIHGRMADFEIVGKNKGCETCHGPGSIHAEEPDMDNIIVFSNIAMDEATAICTSCHDTGNLMDWQGSEHSISGVGCTSCHYICHSPAEEADRLLVYPEPDLCYGCHQDVKMKTYYPSHHPIKEGKMVCTDCHKSHGSFMNSLKTEERLNDLCFNCHSSKQGPFVFEHEPVVEDCNICHEAHGTVTNNLLVQNEPFLCLQCHQVHFHGGKIGNEGTYTDIYDRSIPSNAQSWKAAFTTKCTQCHSQVHGSDLPSQSVMGRGSALSR